MNHALIRPAANLGDAPREPVLNDYVPPPCPQRRNASTPIDWSEAFSLFIGVEPRGLEPLTPTLPVWCATNCATAPRARRGRHPRNITHHAHQGHIRVPTVRDGAAATGDVAGDPAPEADRAAFRRSRA